LRELIKDGVIVGQETLADARARHDQARAELPRDGYKMSRGEPVIPTYYLDQAGAIIPTPYGA
jgi:nicotinate phosphoribosyltransferase